MYLESVTAVDAANLPATVYRTARRLLDRAHRDNGYARISHAELMVVCETQSEATARSHLVQLAAAGLITYRRNSDVHVYWHDWLEAPETETEVPRIEQVEPSTAPAAAVDEVIDSDQSRAVVIAQRSNRAVVIAERSKSSAERSLCEDGCAPPPHPPSIDLSPSLPLLSSSGAGEVSGGGGATVAPPADLDAAYQEVRAVYENNFGLLTIVLSKRIKEALGAYPPQWILMAMERAVVAEKRRWDYVEGILRNWKTEGLNGQPPGPKRTGKPGASNGSAKPNPEPANSQSDYIASLPAEWRS